MTSKVEEEEARSKKVDSSRGKMSTTKAEVKVATTIQAKSAVSSQQVKSTTTAVEQAKATTKQTATATATSIQSTAAGTNQITVITAKTKGGKSETPKQLTTSKEQQGKAVIQKTITVTETTRIAKYETTTVKTVQGANVEGATKENTSALKERSEAVKQVRKVFYRLFTLQSF